MHQQSSHGSREAIQDRPNEASSLHKKTTPGKKNSALIHFKCNNFLFLVVNVHQTCRNEQDPEAKVVPHNAELQRVYRTITAGTAPSFLMESAGGSVNHFSRG